MLCSNKQTVGCCIWYHYNCVGMPLSEGLRLGASKDGFVCPHCSAAASDVSDVHADNFTNGVQDLLSTVNAEKCFTPSGDFQWGDISGGQFCEFIVSAYEEVVH